jgi:hypothetical protein
MRINATAHLPNSTLLYGAVYLYVPLFNSFPIPTNYPESISIINTTSFLPSRPNHRSQSTGHNLLIAVDVSYSIGSHLSCCIRKLAVRNLFGCGLWIEVENWGRND